MTLANTLRTKDEIEEDAAALVFNRDGTFSLLLPRELDGNPNYSMEEFQLLAAAAYLTVEKKAEICPCLLHNMERFLAFMKNKAQEEQALIINRDDTQVH